jgi:hypothetical protein
MSISKMKNYFMELILVFSLISSPIFANTDWMRSAKDLNSSDMWGIESIRDQIIKLVEQHSKIDVQKIQHELQIDYASAKSICDQLVSEGVIFKHGHGKDTFYTYDSESNSPKDANLAIEQFVSEDEIENLVIHDLDWIMGAKWGEPRNGHPEGAVIFHIQEVLRNVELVSTNCEERQKLRKIAIIHDTFKYKVDTAKPKTGENHHAMIARRFAESYINDEGLLEIIELHDDAYNAWAKGNRNNDWNSAYNRARELIDRLGPNLGLYLKFYWCDNNTGDKSLEPYLWFEQIVNG